MNKKLHVLMLEDNPADADLIAEQLADAGLSLDYRRVEYEQDFLRELADFKPDVILADYRLPQFDGLTALRLARERYPFIPFILVSGVLEEEAAVELFKAGAADYIRKGKAARLGTAVKNALSLKAAQEEKARAEEELRQSYRDLERRVEDRTSQLTQANEALSRNKDFTDRILATSLTGLYIFDWDTKLITFINPQYTRLTGYTMDELRALSEQGSFFNFFHPDDVERVITYSGAMGDIREGETREIEYRFQRKDGEWRWFLSRETLFSRNPDGMLHEYIGSFLDITERKKSDSQREAALDALHRREEEFRTLTENAPVGIMRLDKQGTYLYVNREAEQIMHSTREKIVGKRVGMFGMPEEAQSLFTRNIEMTIETRQPAGMEFSLPRKERTYHYQVRFVPEPGAGKPETVLAIFADITGLKEAEERLTQASEEAEKRAAEAEEGRSVLEAIMEYIPEGLLIADAESKKVRMTSKYITDYIGLRWEQMRGISLREYRDFLDISSPAGTPLGPEEIPIWRSLAQGRIVIDEEFVLKKKNGEKANVLINTVPIRDKQGKITGAVASWRDISERKRVEETLRRNEYELRTLVDNSPDLIFRFNRQLQYAYANPAYERLTGISKERLIGKTNDELGMPKELAGFWRSAVKDVLESGRERSAEFEMPGLFGKRHFSARLIPEFEKSGLVETVLVIARDISERKRAEEQIRYISFHDEVTGLFNRAFFEEEIRRVDTDRDLPIGIIIGDVNNLKLTNDVFGHDEGDKLLAVIAKCFRKACRKNDIVARWGGDEFAVILPQTALRTSEAIMSRIGQFAAESAGTALTPSIALGIAVKEHRDQNIYQVIRQAENRMYDHKISHSKENQVMVIDCLLERTRERAKDYAPHIERSSELADRFCGKLGLPEDQMKDLRLLIELHDIGDSVIPPEILAKPGKLNAEEWNAMKKHSEAGFRIVKTYADTAKISDDVLSHGERWDGSGYPRGLKGKDIPFLARVFQIIDAFDVMTHPRPYARMLSRDEAVEELKRNAGTQFDPELTEAFITVISEAPASAIR